MTRTAFGLAKIWLQCNRIFPTRIPSLRNYLRLRKENPVIIAVGGNSFKGLEHATAKNILNILNSGRLPVITHGNGPQVGNLLINHPQKTLAECVHKTQVDMGKQLKEELLRAAKHNKQSIKVKVVRTRVLVHHNDPAFKNPTKYIGPHFPFDELSDGSFGEFSKAHELKLFKLKRSDGQTWLMKGVAGEPGKCRRVVPSPKPLQIYPEDLETICKHVNEGKIVIAVGGGGVAISRNPTNPVMGFMEQAEEAVIDKDLASALLARELEARELIISTGVKEVALNWGKSIQQDIGYFQTKQALRKLKENQFPAGSMGEKIEAAINALRDKVNFVLITDPESDWVNAEGTLLTRGIDITGRLHNLGRYLGLRSDALQRWLVTKAEPKLFLVNSVLSRHSRSPRLKF